MISIGSLEDTKRAIDHSYSLMLSVEPQFSELNQFYEILASQSIQNLTTQFRLDSETPFSLDSQRRQLANETLQRPIFQINPSILNTNFTNLIETVALRNIFCVEDEILVTRPIKELASYFKHRKLPPLQLLARAIKTVALGLFKGHLCDHCLLQEEDQILHNLEGRFSSMTSKEFNSKYPYMLENAYILALKTPPSKTESQKFDCNLVSPDTIREHFKLCYRVDITDKERDNSIADFFKSNLLALHINEPKNELQPNGSA